MKRSQPDPPKGQARYSDLHDSKGVARVLWGYVMTASAIPVPGAL